jgi:hypothetical protein
VAISIMLNSKLEEALVIVGMIFLLEHPLDAVMAHTVAK